MCAEKFHEDDIRFLKGWYKATLKEEDLRKQREKILQEETKINNLKKKALRNKARRQSSGVVEDWSDSETEDIQHGQRKIISPFEISSTSTSVETQILFPKESDNEEKYDKRSGTITDVGMMYEVKMCALIFVKLMNLKAQFHLGCNMSEAEDFDDIVAQYKVENNDSKNKALFIQLKHAAKENTIRNITLNQTKNKSSFGIDKYFQGFNSLHKKIYEDKIFGTCPIDRTYVIYTNADVTRDFVKGDAEVTGLLKELTTKGEVLILDEERLKELRICQGNPVLKNFISSMRICCKQVNYKDIEGIIKYELISALRLSESEIDVVYSSFIESLKYWHQNCSYYLTRESAFWRDIVRETESSRFKARENKLLKLGVKFSNEPVTQLREHIHQNLGIINVICDAKLTTATSLKVVQALREVKPQDYILVGVEECTHHAETLWNTWPNDWCRTLVVDCQIEFNSTQILTDKICPELKYLSQNKVIIISSKDHSWSKYLFKILDIAYKKVRVNPQFFQLDEDSQIKLLCKNINFQGIVIQMKDLLDNSRLLENIRSLKSDALSYLINADVIHVGEDIFISKRENQYVERYVEKISLDEKCTNKKYIAKEADLIEESLTVITAEPGMGKTQLLKTMTWILKKHYQKMWVVLIDLPLYCSYFENMEIKNMRENVISIIRSSLNLNHIKQEFLNLFLDDLKRFIILLDAFDEICPHYTEQVTNMIKFMTSECYSVYVTSRHSMKSYLEKELSVVSYTLQPLTDIMTRTIIVNVWKNISSEYSVVELGKFSDALVSKYSQICHDSKKMFTSNPLHIKMLAEIYMSDIDCLSDNLDWAFNILELYDHFLRKCIQDFFLNKKHSDIYIPAGKYEFETFNSEFNNFNKNVAALQIFGSADMMDREKIKGTKAQTSEYFKLLQNGFDKIGIIESVSKESVNYTHKSFADYYAAVWLVENYKNHVTILEKIITNQEYETVRVFYDLKLAQSSMFLTKLLTVDENILEETFINGENIYEKDCMRRTALHLAAEYNKLKIVKMLKHKIDICSKDEINWSPVRYASETQSWEVLNLILEDIRGDDNEVWKEIEHVKKDIIYVSCMRHYINVINYVSAKVSLNQAFPIPKILQNSKDVDKLSKSMNPNTFVPIHLVVEHNKVDTLKLLVELGCDVNIKNEYLQNILHIAASNGNLEILKYGIEKGVAINDVTKNEKLTAMHIAYMAGHFDVIKYLIENDGNINQETSNGDTILLLPTKRENIEMFKYLINNGSKTHHVNNKGDTPMIAAARQGHFEYVKCLHEKKCDISYINQNDGYSALLAASTYGHFNIVKYCMENGCDKKQVNTQGNTPLLRAALNGHLPVIKYLVGSGCDLHQVNNKDSYNALLCASQSGHLDIVKYCVENGCDVRYENSHGNTALLCASVNGHYDIVKYLVDSRSDDINYVNKNDGYNALLLASESGHLDIVKYCVEKGCDINHVNIYGNTSLMCACLSGNLNIVKCLVNMGCNINYVNKRDGYTTLLCAVDAGYFDIVKFCVENGADLNTKNAVGNTALLCASDKGHKSIVKYLTEQDVT